MMSLKQSVTLLENKCDYTALRLPCNQKTYSYAWYRTFYTDVRLKTGVEMTDDIRRALYTLSRVLRDEHLICWVRQKLQPITGSPEFRSFLFNEMQKTTDFRQLRVIFCMFRMTEHNDFFIDDYCLGIMPTLDRFVVVDDKWNLLKNQQMIEVQEATEKTTQL